VCLRRAEIAQEQRAEQRLPRRRQPAAALTSAPGGLLVGRHERAVRRAGQRELLGSLVRGVGPPVVDPRAADHRGVIRTSASRATWSVVAASPRLIAIASAR
jgi:hypothetical protein